MASISKASNGRKTIQFTAADNKRRSIRLGKMSMRAVEAVKVRVEHLVTASITGAAPDDQTARWLAGLDARLHDKLASAGLATRRERATLGPFIDGYIESRGDVKRATATVYGHTRRNLVAFFGADKPLRDITPGDADAWRSSSSGWLTTPCDGAAVSQSNSSRRRCGASLFRPVRSPIWLRR